jgi:hypothetical protein
MVEVEDEVLVGAGWQLGEQRAERRDCLAATCTALVGGR